MCHISNWEFYDLIEAYKFSTNLVKHGIETEVICKGKTTSNYTENIEGVKVHNIRHNSSFFKESLKIINQNNYDIVHIYQSKGCSYVPLFSKSRKKFILDIRTGSVTGGIKTYLGNKRIRFESFFFENLTVIDESLGNKLFSKKRKYHVLPLGADMKKFYPKQNYLLKNKLGISPEKKVLIYTGTLDAQRKLYNMLSAFKEVLEEFENVVMLIVGKNKDETLKKLVQSLQIDKKVIFVDKVNHNLIPDYINLADIGLTYVPIIKEFEGQPPLKTAEYMSCGLPVVVTNTGGNRTFVRNAYNGVVTNDGVHDFAMGILKLLKDEHLYNECKKNARNSIKDYDYYEIVRSNLIPLYQSLVKA